MIPVQYNNKPERHTTETSNNKKLLSYRRGTGRHAVSVEPMRSDAQMFVEMHFVSPATDE